MVECAYCGTVYEFENAIEIEYDKENKRFYCHLCTEKHIEYLKMKNDLAVRNLEVVVNEMKNKAYSQILKESEKIIKGAMNV